MAVNLCAAHKKTDSRVQHTKYYSRASYNCAAHKDGSRVVHKIELTCTTRKITLVTGKFGPSNMTKVQEHTRVAAHECQLRNELYRIIYEFFVSINNSRY